MKTACREGRMQTAGARQLPKSYLSHATAEEKAAAPETTLVSSTDQFCTWITCMFPIKGSLAAASSAATTTRAICDSGRCLHSTRHPRDGRRKPIPALAAFPRRLKSWHPAEAWDLSAQHAGMGPHNLPKKGRVPPGYLPGRSCTSNSSATGLNLISFLLKTILL